MENLCLLSEFIAGALFIWGGVGNAGEGAMYTMPFSPLTGHFKQAMLE